MKRLAAGALSAVLLLGGCTGPRYVRPDVPVPPSYRGDSPAPRVSGPADDGETSSLGELRWQDLIHDEELSKLIREALAHNHDVQIAAARVLEARGQLTITRSTLFPLTSAQASYNNLRTAQDGSSPLPPGYPATATTQLFPSIWLGKSTCGDNFAMRARPRGPACLPVSKRGGQSCNRW